MRNILILDMSYDLKMYKDRQLVQALESRKLGGYFNQVISVHPLAGLFASGASRFGDPIITQVDDHHIFIEGKIGISCVWSMIPPLNFLFAQVLFLRLLVRLCRKYKIDVVRIGDPHYLGIMGLILSWFLRIPLVIRVSGNYDWLRKNTGKLACPKLFKYLFIEKFIERFVLKRCDLVAAPNKNNLDYAILNGVQPERGIIFRYGNLIHPLHFSDPSTRKIKGRQFLDQLGVVGPFLTTVSRLEVIKQSDHNLFVLKRLRERGHLVNFLFIGDGSMRAHLKKLSEQLGLSNYVFFAGNRSQEWIAEILPLAQLVLSPHMGRALTEACLAGAPIVAFDVDWQGEIIKSAETGELVPTGDWEEMANKAAYLLDNPELSYQFGCNARNSSLKMMDPRALDDVEIAAYETLFNMRGSVCEYRV